LFTSQFGQKLLSRKIEIIEQQQMQKKKKMDSLIESHILLRVVKCLCPKTNKGATFEEDEDIDINYSQDTKIF